MNSYYFIVIKKLESKCFSNGSWSNWLAYIYLGSNLLSKEVNRPNFSKMSNSSLE